MNYCKALQHDQKSEKNTITYDNYKERQFIIQTRKSQIIQKSQVSSPKGNLQTPSQNAKKQIFLCNKKSMNITSERSTQMSVEKDLFNDKFIVENQERLNILQKLQGIRLQNVMMKSKTKSSNDLYREFQQEYNNNLDSKKAILNEKLKLCQNEIHQQQQNLSKDEINLKENQKELEILKEQLQFIKDSIQQIKNQNLNRKKEITCKLQIDQIKEKQLLIQIIKYIESLQDQYNNHLIQFKDYLFQLKLNIDSIRIDQEFDKNQ